MAKVSFGSCTAVQFTAKVTGSALVPRRIYFVTNGTLVSIIHALTNNTYNIVYQDAIASQPAFNTTGYQLSYTDASGATKTIDLSALTVGNKAAPGIEMTTGGGVIFRGNIGTNQLLTDAPTVGVAIGDIYYIATAGTYGGVVCAVSDYLKATATTPTWVKSDGSEIYTGTIKNGDTIAKALGKLQNAIEDLGSIQSAYATKLYVDQNFLGNNESITMSAGNVLTLGQNPTQNLEAATKEYVDNKLISLLALQASPASVAAFNALTGIRVGFAYRITAAGTYAGEVCAIGDLIVAIAVTTGVTATTTWMVLQNNIDLAGVFTTVGVGLEEVAGASGKTIRMPVITQTNTTTGSATLTFAGTVTIVDSVTRDTYGRVTGINTKTMTMPSETVLSGLSSNALAAYKIMTNLTSSGHALTATYADFLGLAMTGWGVDTNVGNIVAGDTLKGALNRLQNRIGKATTGLEPRMTVVEGLQDWIDG